MSEDIQFQIECLSTELVELLMQKYGWGMKTALDELYSSETYKPVSYTHLTLPTILLV